MTDLRIKPKMARAQLSGRMLLARWIVRGRMTQAEAAEQIGVSRVKLNQYLQGSSRPSLETATRIEDATGIGMRSWLVDDPTPSKPGPLDVVEDRSLAQREADGDQDRPVR
jgi:transcriptional regulator with XRE-family HTH domain